MNDEFGESAEQEMSEEQPPQDEEGAEFEAGSFEREEGSDNEDYEGEQKFDNKRDEVIQQLLSKDDIAMIQARI
jgi:hypothetical protein